jgi:hypothetical protein
MFNKLFIAASSLLPITAAAETKAAH